MSDGLSPVARVMSSPDPLGLGPTNLPRRDLDPRAAGLTDAAPAGSGDSPLLLRVSHRGRGSVGSLFRRRWAIVSPNVAGPSFWRYWTLTAACHEAGRRNARLVLNGQAPSWRVESA